MELPSLTSRFFVQQSLRALERRGTEPELARTLAEVLDRDPNTDEAKAAYTERNYLREQLRRAREELERTHAKLEASRRVADRSKTRSKRLAERNRFLTARYSGRRYRLVDALMRVVCRILGIALLTGRSRPSTDR